MGCFDEGVLQAYLDNEVTIEEKKKIKNHLQTCAVCNSVLRELEDNANFVDLHLTTYKKQMDRTEPGYANFHRYGPDKGKIDQQKGVFHLINKYKKLVAGVAVAATLGISLSFAPVREAAAEFLTLFRVQKIETTSISIDDLNQIGQAFYNSGANLDIKNFGKVENTHIGETKQVSWDEAVAAVDFEAGRPAYLPDGMQLEPTVALNPAVKVKFTLNVGNVNRVLKELGGKNLLPEELDGKAFALSVNQSLQSSAHIGDDMDARYVSFMQTRSPEIKLPDGIDANQVRKAFLDLPVIPPNIKEKLASLNNWQDTLYVPQPSNGSAKNVVVKGVDGVLVTEDWGQGRTRYTLMWQQDGVLNALYGTNIEADEMFKIAESVK